MGNKVKHNFYFEERTNHTAWGQPHPVLSNRRANQILCCESSKSVCFETHQSFLLENKAKQMLLFSKSESTLFWSAQGPLCRQCTKTHPFRRRATVFPAPWCVPNAFGVFRNVSFSVGGRGKTDSFRFGRSKWHCLGMRKVLCRRNSQNTAFAPLSNLCLLRFSHGEVDISMETRQIRSCLLQVPTLDLPLFPCAQKDNIILLNARRVWITVVVVAQSTRSPVVRSARKIRDV